MVHIYHLSSFCESQNSLLQTFFVAVYKSVIQAIECWKRMRQSANEVILKHLLTVNLCQRLTQKNSAKYAPHTSVLDLVGEFQTIRIRRQCRKEMHDTENAFHISIVKHQRTDCKVLKPRKKMHPKLLFWIWSITQQCHSYLTK